MPLANGAVFAGYTIQRQLGSGGMGEVYLTQHPRLPRLEALKILPSSLTEDVDFRQRFNREADLAATLWHPNIVGLHDRGEFDGQLWITMDYVEGTDAACALQDSDGLPPAQVLEIVTAVADALDYAHHGNLLHRDVKPANILLTRSDSDQRRILLADFGIARKTDDISGLTATNATIGSIAYAAPEQLMGQALDGRSDQYALAATAFHMLAGTAPFQHSNAAVVIGKHLTAPPPLLSERRPALAGLDWVLAKAMSKNPAQRYPRCSDFARALGDALTGVSAHSAAATAPWPPVGPVTHAAIGWPSGPPIPYHRMPSPTRKRKWPAIVVPLVLVLLFMGAVGFAATQVLRPYPVAASTPRWQPYVDYAKQFTIWLTSLSAHSSASDVQRIIDGSTGEFHDDFANRSSDFRQVVEQAQVTTEGTVDAAALESISGATAQVLVAASSKVTNSGGTNDKPRAWRLTLRVERLGDAYKVSKVEFVS
ncbi:protein kinase [Mycobacterium asiaticum]|uniref:non-specific serine/threonine protein kinase n=1 Tax=Mycobacterium asiaticum TaxID=1790 RepID=A0A1A3NIU5_MYCAS|nr:serine/threonine-protein kinase [Mycobacterium asiaticum]OBK21255.1 protein kinase [Mycobacterium asiaticum]